MLASETDGRLGYLTGLGMTFIHSRWRGFIDHSRRERGLTWGVLDVSIVSVSCGIPDRMNYCGFEERFGRVQGNHSLPHALQLLVGPSYLLFVCTNVIISFLDLDLNLCDMRRQSCVGCKSCSVDIAQLWLSRSSKKQR